MYFEFDVKLYFHSGPWARRFLLIPTRPHPANSKCSTHNQVRDRQTGEHVLSSGSSWRGWGLGLIVTMDAVNC